MKIAHNVPPFSVKPPTIYKTTDFMTLDGARLLCRMVEEVWRSVGVTTVTAEPELRHLNQTPRYAVRIHGLTNGAPA